MKVLGDFTAPQGPKPDPSQTPPAAGPRRSCPNAATPARLRRLARLVAELRRRTRGPPPRRRPGEMVWTGERGSLGGHEREVRATGWRAQRVLRYQVSWGDEHGMRCQGVSGSSDQPAGEAHAQSRLTRSAAPVRPPCYQTTTSTRPPAWKAEMTTCVLKLARIPLPSPPHHQNRSPPPATQGSIGCFRRPSKEEVNVEGCRDDPTRPIRTSTQEKSDRQPQTISAEEV